MPLICAWVMLMVTPLVSDPRAVGGHLEGVRAHLDHGHLLAAGALRQARDRADGGAGVVLTASPTCSGAGGVVALVLAPAWRRTARRRPAAAPAVREVVVVSPGGGVVVVDCDGGGVAVVEFEAPVV